MHRSTVNEALSRLFVLQYRSFPQFVLHASPYVRPGDEPIVQVLRDAVDRQEAACHRLADAILRRRGQLPGATYPMRFMGGHYLDLRFLLRRLVVEQRFVVLEIERLLAMLQSDREAETLAQEVLLQERQLRQELEDLLAEREPAREDRHPGTGSARPDAADSFTSGRAVARVKSRDTGAADQETYAARVGPPAPSGRGRGRTIARERDEVGLGS